MDLTLAEAEPPEALRMLRAGYVDVALVFMHEPDVAGQGARATMLLVEPVCLVTRADHADAPSPRSGPDLAAHAREQWIAGLRPLPRLPASAVRACRVHPEDRFYHR